MRLGNAGGWRHRADVVTAVTTKCVVHVFIAKGVCVFVPPSSGSLS
jgi:hypothetical protein